MGILLFLGGWVVIGMGVAYIVGRSEKLGKTDIIDEPLYYPCIKDGDTGEITRVVGPAMTWDAAVEFLKKNYSVSWQYSNACPQKVTDK